LTTSDEEIGQRSDAGGAVSVNATAGRDLDLHIACAGSSVCAIFIASPDTAVDLVFSDRSGWNV
jgi:hypothetical protein